MALYRVNDDGRAPSGLGVGDEVVTAGGTYRIDSVGADGQYKSTLVNKGQTTQSYKGGYSTRNTLPGYPDYTAGRLGNLERGYSPSGAVSQAKAYLQQVQSRRPGAYQSRWDAELDSLYDQITNRKPFQYDLNQDALYQQYKEQYQRLGRTAMQDTMGQAASLTGGYGSTYAEQVGQQTYNAYLQSLNDIVPELYDRAYGRYQDEGQDLYNRYGLVSDRESMDYSKYRDTVSDYYNDLADARSSYDSEWNKDYTQWSDQLSYWQQKAAQEQAYWQSQQKAAGGSGGGGGGRAGSSGTGSGKGYIDNTYNSGGAGGAMAQTYNQLKRGMTEWIMAGQPEKAYDLFLSMAGQLNLSNSTGKKQYNELVSILNKAGYGIPKE
nr:MAG TPA: Transcription initiation factor TFIID subunit, DNA, Nuclear [Caudoviricetes sp.]